ncbi:hypothetical protein SAMN04489727_1933 [Amycolatopsis tolypomycina]|uniref:SH3 domain-containing protein n=1 Tax=Amycolatopsis tolypomycina TaxID=208445 RepID=A0A1H4JJN7_9PSEU|nr:hypothetical protein SAMN04489727_1933 [Amycolatopsis tolypomycina]
MMLSHRVRLGLVAAAAAATTVGGAGLADAATGHAPVPAPAAHSAAKDVGVPSEVDSSAPVTAPDGTRIWGLTALPFGGHATRTRQATREGRAASTQSAIEVDILASGARLRASVPRGTVIGLAYPGQTAWGGCQIPGSDGYVWGWLSVQTSAGWRSGWMRHDLWSITQHTYPGGGSDPSSLPWC